MKPSISRNVPGGTYQVTKRLPEKDGEFEYHIKNVEEPCVRVLSNKEIARKLGLTEGTVRAPRYVVGIWRGG
jgi:hypothetical protein